MELVTLKLTDGSDIVGELLDLRDDLIIVGNPIDMHIDPEYGFFAKSYMLLIEGNEAQFNTKDLFMWGSSSPTAIKYYHAFIDRLNESQGSSEDFSSEEEDNIEEDLQSLWDSKKSTIH